MVISSIRSIHQRCSVKKRCEKFCNIYRKPPVLEFLYQNETLTQVFSCEYCEVFKDTCYEEHLRTATSVVLFDLKLCLEVFVYRAIWEQEFFFFFSYLDFLSRTFTNHRTAGEGGGHFFNSSLPLPPASQTLKHQSGYYCRELTSAHRQKPDSNRELLVSERKSLTTKLRAQN